ncbi:hypothetical protein [Pandoraea commovens]|uniref:Uncharacterized protein n=1 Tax=Pandoraea commovens TaxID=2508289 RepID=A0A5E4RZP2_9BURK|nr:hypothetical protein [Pandoraea commovens]VVD68403.1 hypothetical protein PCO31010_00478 [Pandoraea commovens]
MSEKKTYEVVQPIRLERRSHPIGARVHAEPDHVADLVAGGVLREVGDAVAQQRPTDGAQSKAGANPDAALDTAPKGTSAGVESGSQAAKAPDSTAQATNDQPTRSPVKKPAAKVAASKNAPKRGTAAKSRQ